MLCPRCGRGKFKITHFYCGVCQIELKRMGKNPAPRDPEYPDGERTKRVWKGYNR
jgi:hypothetical protein